MSAGQRWNLANDLTAAGADLQAKVTSRNSRQLSDPVMVEALTEVRAAIGALGRAAAMLTTAEDEGADDAT